MSRKVVWFGVLFCLSMVFAIVPGVGAAELDTSSADRSGDNPPVTQVPGTNDDDAETSSPGDEELRLPGPRKDQSGTRVDETKGMREITLQEVVITATRKEALVEDTPASVTIVGTEELEKSALKTVDDVLRSVAGVDIWGSNLDPLGQRAVTVRGVGGGSSQERTLILIDGVPVNDSWSGSVVWNQVAKEDVERVEVVRGPSSSLYGTNAMGGVVNIITKLPATAPISGVLKGTYGELNTWYTYGNVSGRLCDGRYGYYLSGKRAGTDGYRVYKDEPMSTETEAELSTLYSQLVWFPDEHSYIRASGNYFHEERNKGFPYNNLDPGEILKGNITYRRSEPNGINLLGILYGHDEEQRHENDTWMHDGLDRVSSYDKPFYGVILQPSFPLASWNTLTVGAEFKHSSATQNDEYEVIYPFRPEPRRTETHGKQQYFGFYVQDEATFFGDRLIVIPGARYDYWESYDGSRFDSASDTPLEEYESKDWQSFNPKLGIVYKLTKDTSLRGSAGTGYRAPSPVELYASSSYGASTLVKGNPDLEPEKVFAYEIGGIHTFGDHLDLRLTLYRAEVEDLIDSVLVEDLGFRTIYEKANISQVTAQGVEFEAYYRLNKEWYGFFNYTYNESSIEEDKANPDTEGNWLAHSPFNKVNIGLTYDNPRLLTGTVQARYRSDSYDDNQNMEKVNSYWTLDVYLSRRIGKHLKVSFDIENILDEEYDIPGFNTYEAPGRLWAGALTMEF